MKKIVLDAGIFSIYFSKDSVEKKPVVTLFKGNMKSDKGYDLFIVSPVISEVFYHICLLYGKESARSMLSSVLKQYQIKILTPTKAILYMAGELKCQHRTKLSYNDGIMIATARLNKMAWYTTEKKIASTEKILNNKIPYKYFKWD